MKPFGGPGTIHFNLGDAEQFSAHAFVRRRLFETPGMHFNVYCIAPGQQNPLHRHPDSDEILYFVRGTGRCVVGEQVCEVKHGDLVFVARNVPHAVINTHRHDELVCVLAQAPLPCIHVPVTEQGETCPHNG
jgi:quercetin dioxygenase-like cupin family protein